MIRLISLFLIVPLAACFDTGSGSSKDDIKSGTFKAKVGDKQYDLPIHCRDFNPADSDPMITFYSDFDTAGNSDSDGDGIILGGSRIKIGKDKSPIQIDGISININDHGIMYENNIGVTAMLGNKKTWNFTANGVTGTDELYEGDEMDNNKVTIVYELTCQ